MLKFLNRQKPTAVAPTRQAPDSSIPGFRHRTHEPEYARLALPFCRQDSIRKLAVLLDEEVALRNAKQNAADHHASD
jgi:hypothetical protein